MTWRIIRLNQYPNTYPYNYYWTSTTYAPDPANAWDVYFTFGITSIDGKDIDLHVRLVRSGQSFDDFDLLELEYTITTTVNPAGGGTVTCDPNPVPDGESSTCTATPNPGYSFANWSEACTGSENPCELTNVTAPKSVTANFTKSIPPTPTPALGPWGLSLLASLLAGLGGFQIWRVRRVHR